MRLAMILLAVLLGLFSLRLISISLGTVMKLIKSEEVSSKAQGKLYQNLIMGVLLLILSVSLILP